MKKVILAFAAASMILAVSSCKKEATAESQTTNEGTEQTAETSTQATPTMAPQDYNAKVGAEYLDSLKNNDKDVKFTESGLGYKVTTQGKGAVPSMSNVVDVKYTGKHIDGSVFDSSGDQVVSFPLNGVIPGFAEGISMMPVGSTFTLYIPSNLGYGPNGAGNVIGPNETLIFDIELVGIQ